MGRAMTFRECWDRQEERLRKARQEVTIQKAALKPEGGVQFSEPEIRERMAAEREEAERQAERDAIRGKILEAVAAKLKASPGTDPVRVAEAVRVSPAIQRMREKVMLAGGEDPAPAGSAGQLVRELETQQKRAALAASPPPEEAIAKAHLAIRKTAEQLRQESPGSVGHRVMGVQLVDELLSEELRPLVEALAADGDTLAAVTAMSLLPGWFSLHEKLTAEARRCADEAALQAGHTTRAAMVGAVVKVAQDRQAATTDRRLSVADAVREVLGELPPVAQPYRAA